MSATERDSGGPSSPLPADLRTRLQEKLGMPFLPTVFQLLADHESFLRAATEAFPAPARASVEQHGSDSRRIAADAAGELVSVPLHAGSSAERIARLIDRYNQVNPPSLLFTLFLSPGSTSAFRVMEPPLPTPPARGGGDALLADIRACHGGFNIPGFWRELAAGWPEHSTSAWRLVRALPASPRFAGARQALLSLAGERTARGSAPTPMEVGCAPAEAREIQRILSFYAVVIPTMIVEIECLRRALALGASRSSARLFAGGS